MKTSIKLVLPLVAATLCGLASASAPVKNRGAAPAVIVTYQRAALASRAGVESLHGRLGRAAQSVCTQLDSRVLGLRTEHDRCVRDAISRSVADVGNENLTSYHRHHALFRVLAAS